MIFSNKVIELEHEAETETETENDEIGIYYRNTVSQDDSYKYTDDNLYENNQISFFQEFNNQVNNQTYEKNIQSSNFNNISNSNCYPDFPYINNNILSRGNDYFLQNSSKSNINSNNNNNNNIKSLNHNSPNNPYQSNLCHTEVNKNSKEKEKTQKSFTKSIVYKNETFSGKISNQKNFQTQINNKSNYNNIDIEDSFSESMSLQLKNNSDYFTQEKSFTCTLNQNNTNNNNNTNTNNNAEAEYNRSKCLNFEEKFSKDDLLYFSNLSNQLKFVGSYDEEIKKNYPIILKDIYRKLV
jgi:hypothetical protein